MSSPVTVEISSPLGTTRGVTRDSGLCGPHIAVFAGVHGDEIASQIAAAVLAQAAIPARGKFTVFVNANPASCIARLRYAPAWSGGSEEDLNRCFGIFSDGPEHLHTVEISDWLRTTKPTFVIDMHEGNLADGPERTPLWYFAETDAIPSSYAAPEEIAGFAPAVLDSNIPTSLTGECAYCGIPALCQETRPDVPLFARVSLHLLSVGTIADKISAGCLRIDSSQIDFMLKNLRP